MTKCDEIVTSHLSSPSLTQTQVQVLGKLRLGTTLIIVIEKIGDWKKLEILVHVPSRCCGIIKAIFHDFGTNSMVHSDWDSAPRFVCGPNFICDLIGESTIFSAVRNWVSFDFKVGLGILQIASAKRRPQVWPWFDRSLFSTSFVEFDQAV